MSRSERVLITWIGRSDVSAAEGGASGDDPGPVLRLLRKERFTWVYLLNDIDVGLAGAQRSGSARYREWLIRQVSELAERVICHDAPESLRNDYGRAYEFTRQKVEAIRSAHAGSNARFALLLSPAYPAAQVAMLIASQTLFEPPSVEVFNTSPERGVERVDLSYRLSIDVVPAVLRRWARAVHEATVSPCFESIVGTSEAITAAKKRASRVATCDVAVLIRGETGTGKELFAKAIHEASPRKEKPFVALHCAALSSTLIESELFGHVKGAFTDARADRKGRLEEAHGGTLFLDEVGDLPLETQVKLLRFIESGEFSPVGSNQVKRVDVRLIAATNRNLEKGVAEGRFREDFLYRLDTVTLWLPPLRYRGKDTQELAGKFLEEFNKWQGKRDSGWQPKVFSKEALTLLSRYPWPGNVRQLQRVVQRLAIFSVGPEIREEDVAAELEEAEGAVARPLAELAPAEFGAYVVAALEELVARFRVPGALPWEFDQEASLVDKVILPLLVGRSLKLTEGKWSPAGRLFQKSGLERNNKTDRDRADAHKKLMEAIDENLVARIRSGA